MVRSRKHRDLANDHDFIAAAVAAAAAAQRMKEWMKIGQCQERQRKEREVILVSPPHQKSWKERMKNWSISWQRSRNVPGLFSSSSVGSSLSSSTGAPSLVQVVTCTVAEKKKLPKGYRVDLNTFVKYKGFDLWPILQSKHLSQNPQIVEDMLDDMKFNTPEDHVAYTKICKQSLVKNINELCHNKKSVIRDKYKCKLSQWWWEKLVTWLLTLFAAVSCTITGLYVTKGDMMSHRMVEKLGHIEKADVKWFRVGCFEEQSNKIKEKMVQVAALRECRV